MLRLRSRNLERFARSLERAPATFERLQAPRFRRSLDLLKDAAVTRTPTRSGRMRRAWRVRVGGAGSRLTGTVENTMPYAGAVDQGARLREIRPKRKKALNWRGVRGEVFAARADWPGFRGRYIVRRALASARPRIARELAGAVFDLARSLKT